MPVTIGELTTEVIAEGTAPTAEPAPAPAESAPRASSLRGELAALERLAMRTSAEGFDD
jgi:hypothetical protein